MTLQEIDRRLALLPKYLEYRINWMANYGPVATLLCLKYTGIMWVHDDLVSFEQWLSFQPVEIYGQKFMRIERSDGARFFFKEFGKDRLISIELCSMPGFHREAEVWKKG